MELIALGSLALLARSMQNRVDPDAVKSCCEVPCKSTFQQGLTANVGKRIGLAYAGLQDGNYGVLIGDLEA